MTIRNRRKFWRHFFGILAALEGASAWGKSPHDPAYLSFAADKAEYTPGEIATLSWASANAVSCIASGDWNGKMPTEGYYDTPPLDGPKTYTLKCHAQSGSVEKTLNISVALVSESTATPYPLPMLSFTAADTSVVSGASTILSWSATNADSCSASDGWSGIKSTSGDELVGPIEMDTTFALSCIGEGGSVRQSVSVDAEPMSATSLSLTASDLTVSPGGLVTLTWTGESVSNCLASDAWWGLREPNGSETVGPINVDSTYTLTCETTTDVLIAATTVLVSSGGTTISWLAPSENVDGSALQDLASFGIYVGTVSGIYDEHLEVLDPHATSFFVPLAPGEYYFAMTAMSAEGNESAYSNEVVKTVQ